MSSFRGESGELATTHRLSRRQVLLPFEAELCNAVGISKDEYFEFLAQAEATVVKREGYEHIPDVRNEITTTTLAVIQLVVGLALTAASALLAPKIRSDDEEILNVKRPDQIGPNRFTPTFAFSSVQELARLGQTVPLVFADQPAIGSGDDADSTVLRGGVRANSLLTFSLVSALGGGQRMRLLAVASFIDKNNGNTLARRPDYEGLAFGDQLVNDYNPTRVAAYFRGGDIGSTDGNDGLMQQADQYEQYDYQLDPKGNPTRSWWHVSGARERVYVGVRNPSNETTFGAYSPMPNANYWKVDFKMFINPDDSPTENDEQVKQEREKINSEFPIYAGIISRTKRNGKVTEVVYKISGVNNELNNTEFLGKSWSNDAAVTAEDVKNQINQEREKINSTLNEGDTYLLGNQLGILIRKTGTLKFGSMEGSDRASDVTCTFRMLSDGAGESDNSGGAPTVIPNSKSRRFSYTSLDDDGKREDKNYPESQANYRTSPHYEESANQIQAYAEAIVANNVACNCTEIGIGSTVFKKFTGCNVNNFPGDAYITRQENKKRGGSYDMGVINVYAARYSFFEIQIRKQGQTTWDNVLNRSGYFAVNGRTPVERFNAVRIYHPRGQYEFRMRPVASKFAYWQDKRVYLLQAENGLDNSPTYGGTNNITQITQGVFTVVFEGKNLSLGDRGTVSNPVTFKGPEDAKNEFTVQAVSPNFWAPSVLEWELSPTTNNPYYVGPTELIDPLPDPCLRNMVVRRVYWQRNQTRWIYYYKGDRVADFWVDGTATPPNELNVLETANYDPTTCNNYTARNRDDVRYAPIGYIENAPQHVAEIKTGVQTNFYYIIKREVKTARTADGRAVSTLTLGGSGEGLRVILQKYKDGSYTWQLDSRNRGEGYYDGDIVYIPEIPSTELQIRVDATPNTQVQDIDPGWGDYGDTAPYSQITDYYQRSNEEGSHHDQPEHRIAYVNEMILAPTDNSSGTYKNLASLGFTILSSKQTTNLSQLSIYYKKGIKVEQLSTTGRASRQKVVAASHIFPEIAYFLLTNRCTGAGNVISPDQIDRASFERAADFCRANQHFWDGVIDERVNIRDFIFKNAAYCLLDFTMKGGRFGLEPSVPYNSDFTIKLGTSSSNRPTPEIKALFTDGNITDLKVTTLPPEERKLMEVEVLHREERVNQFPVTRSYNVRLDTYRSDLAVETFDFTQWATSRPQVLNFAKYALKTRQLIDHTIEFKTTLQSMAGVEPSDYIRVVSELCHPNRFLNGHVTDDGTIQAAGEIPNNQLVYYWKPSFASQGSTGTSIRTGNMQVSAGKANSTFYGCVFAAVSSTTTDRVYKVDSIAIDDDGFVSVAATHMPVDANGDLLIMKGWANDDDFVINGQD